MFLHSISTFSAIQAKYATNQVNYRETMQDIE